ncbi:hypothetical protein JYA63_10565 [Fictibacillus nanhaiensis]|uniref:Uncharacterized protein n=1 Tax=Fictibacillus nanhaiensis TaxID=742169 RepID=A0ABS2ZRQ5_9BACL|nr:hypothetical protein [Fictibacillus nanhaiensis]
MNVHLVFGESTTGAMKWLLNKEKRQEHVIRFPCQKGSYIRNGENR